MIFSKQIPDFQFFIGLMKKVPLKIVTLCMELNDIPSKWKIANVYSIPKPKPGWSFHWRMRSRTREGSTSIKAIPPASGGPAIYRDVWGTSNY